MTNTAIKRALSLHEKGLLAEAASLYREVLAGDAKNADALYLLGVLESQRGNLLAAIELIEEAINIRPNDVAFLKSRGNALLKLGRVAQALADYDRVLTLTPDDADALNNRGCALHELGRFYEALASYERTLATNPDQPHVLNNLGLTLQKLRRTTEALASYDHALAIAPGDANTLYNRGNLLQDLRRYNEALSSYDRALAARPDYVGALNNRGAAFGELKRFDEALASYDRALAIDPNDADTLINRGNILEAMKRFDEATGSYGRALAVKPGHPFLFGRWLFSKMRICDWHGLAEDFTRLTAKVQAAEKATPLFAALATPLSAAQLRACAELYIQEMHPKSPLLPELPGANRHDRIRLGYFSSDFRNHPVAHLIAGLFEQHDRSKFEVFGFSLGFAKKDSMRTRLEASFDRFVEVNSLSDKDVALAARRLEIDIAVDLNGFTTDGRTGIFALGAAPIQVSYLGYPGTMGADYIDYVIADATVIPEDQQEHFAEKIAYLPDSYQVSDSKRLISDRRFSKSECGLPETGFVFCCFNNHYKIAPNIFDVWMRLLKKVEGSVLWLPEANAVAMLNLRKEAEARKVSGSRLVFAPFLGKIEDHLARLKLADLFLDTLPFNGHTTASDALFAGLPLLTCLGETFQGRVAASLLYAIGLPELVTKDLEAYEALALELSANPQKLLSLRQKLTVNRSTHPLFDTAQFARNIEAAYSSMYKQNIAGLPPEHIFVKSGPPPPISGSRPLPVLKEAVSLHQKGDLAKAELLYRGVLAHDPKNAAALHLLGVLEGQRKNLSAAIELIDRAIALEPKNPSFLFNRGEVLVKLRRYDDALANFDRILAIKPDSADALFKRANVLQALKRFEAAVASYDRALAIKPDYAGALNNRGNALEELKRFDEALQSYERALAIQPDYTGALYNRGNLLLQLDQHEEALASFDRALAIKPDYAEALDQRGCALLELHRPGDAKNSFERALAIKPDPAWHSNLIFALNFDSEADAELHQAERSRWNELHASKFTPLITQHTNNPDPNRRLRVGYVSSSFSKQAATFAFGGVILCHDPRQFDVFCYSDTAREDAVTAQFRGRVHTWYDTAALADEQLAALVRADGIDILVDCVGHMRDHRLLVFARKPAPIQVTAWGEPTGTGLKTMDYLLADPVLVPIKERTLLAERVYDLPNFLGYWTPDTLPEPNPLPALKNGYVTFGSFNRFAKVQDPVLRSWAAILRQLPSSRLVLKCNQLLFETGQRRRIEGILAEAGVNHERVTFLTRSDRTHHFSAYQQVDIALDPFPHGGGMTTLDSLYMGVPVVTFPGRTISSRLAAASLSALGLTDFIASDVDSYVQLAVAKAGDLETLSQLRSSLQSRISNSEFGNAPSYARAVEAGYRKMWQSWCEKPWVRRDNAKSRPRAQTIRPDRIADANDRSNSARLVMPGKLEFDRLKKLVGTDAPVILEIGANDGGTTAQFLSAFPKCKIYAFEPDPRAIAKFKHRIQDRRAQLFEIAIGAEDREASFHVSSGLPAGVPPEVVAQYTEGWDQSGSLRLPKKHTQVWPWVKFENKITVEVRRLDSWAQEHGIANIDFIWADVQGAEGDLVAGGLVTLAKTRYFYVEYSNDELYEGQANLRQLMEMLDKFVVIQRFPMDVLFKNTAL